MIGALALISLRDWQRHKLRFVLTTAGIALGVAVFFAIETANETLVDSLNTTFEKLAGRATLQVTAGDAGFPGDAIKAVRSTEGVALAEPVTETLVSTSLGSDRLLILGFDTTSDLSLYTSSIDQQAVVIKNPVAFQNRKDSVAITKTLASRHRLKDGDKFTVNAPSGRLELTVRGIFDATGIGEVYGGNLAVMDIYSAQDLFGRGNKIDRIDVANAAGMNVDDLQARLQEKLGIAYDVRRPDVRGKALEDSITTMHAAFTITSILALTIGVFIIFNSFSISVNQRWKEIAIIRSLGVERRNVRLMFTAESVVQGLVGSALGIVGGFFLAQLAMQAVVRVSASIYAINPTPGAIRFQYGFAAQAFLLGFLSSVVAVWVPARAAARLEPALALRNVATRTGKTKAGFVRIAAGLALVLAGLLLTYLSPALSGSYLQTSYSFAIQLGMVLLLPTFIEYGARVLRPVMRSLFGVEGVLAVDTMAHAPRRTVATVAAIMIGLNFAFSIASLIASQKSAVYASLDKAFAADIIVTASEQLHSQTDHFSGDIAASVTSLPEIEHADAVRIALTEYDGSEIVLLAHDMRAYFEISPNLVDQGDPARARDLTSKGEGVMLSESMSFRWNLRIGDTLHLRTPNGDLAVPIVGLINYYRPEKGVVFIDRGLYRRYWEDTSVDSILIDVKPGVDRQAFKQKILAATADTHQAFVYTHDEYKAWATRLIEQFFTLMYMQMLVAVLIAAIGLVNTMLISVAERRREIGIFRAIGGLRSQVVKMVLLEASAISIMGFVTGTLTGIMNSYFVVKTAAKSVAGYELPLVLPLRMVAVAVPIIIAIAMFSAWLPAWKAARLQVAEAIGYE